jgi:hypothetical protein
MRSATCRKPPSEDAGRQQNDGPQSLQREDTTHKRTTPPQGCPKAGEFWPAISEKRRNPRDRNTQYGAPQVPFRVVKRGGGKVMQLPKGAPAAWFDSAMVNAIARAFRWRKLLDTGAHATLVDLARAKRLPPFSGIVRLTPARAGHRGGGPGRAATTGGDAGASAGVPVFVNGRQIAIHVHPAAGHWRE